MALKLPLPKLDKRGVAIARARFAAWWDGADFDPAAAEAAFEAQAAAAANDAGVEAELFKLEAPPVDLRLEALQRIWGEGRILPGDAAVEATFPTKLELSTTAQLAVFGPGLVAPVAALAQTHLGELKVSEWREETQAHLKFGLAKAGLDKRVAVSAIDLETFAAPVGSFEGLISFDDFTYADNGARLAQQIAKAMKPKASAIIETYAALPGGDLSPAFATAFSEPHLRASGDIQTLLSETGLTIVSHDDVTDEHLANARAGFKRLADALAEGPPLAPGAGRELAWEAEAWRVRMRLLATRRLERRRLHVTRPE
ncbi:MAG: hypothetical protein SGJ23_07695 [Alphaproteobacteria bacterium]|nr:hypothetical protein [Alphaproteobacteria bacterium]